ncbi:MAG: undecaprenyl-phosphate glucose phosphotransferase, partial [Planctomycetota bacterium]
NLESTPGLGMKVAGFFDDRVPCKRKAGCGGCKAKACSSKASPTDRLAELPAELGSHVGSLADVVANAKAGEVDTVYITFPMRAEERIRGLLNELADTTASVYIVPDFFVFELLHARWTSIDGLPVVSVHENPLYGVDGLLKRGADLAFSTVLLGLLSLPMLAIAALVKFTSSGPVFFRQKRYGLDGREILVWKFRSMRVQENGAKVTQATKNDSRITRVGGVLRRTSLDELPQLFNVIEGTMSLVGPRPHATAHNEQYRSLIDGYMLRHKVKPGITGLAQVMGFRGETDTLDKMEGRVRFDKEYIRRWSLWMDLKILFQTVGVVLRQQNAY